MEGLARFGVDEDEGVGALRFFEAGGFWVGGLEVWLLVVTMVGISRSGRSER